MYRVFVSFFVFWVFVSFFVFPLVGRLNEVVIPSADAWICIFALFFYFIYLLIYFYFILFFPHLVFITWRLITLLQCSGFCHTLFVFRWGSCTGCYWWLGDARSCIRWFPLCEFSLWYVLALVLWQSRVLGSVLPL